MIKALLTTEEQRRILLKDEHFSLGLNLLYFKDNNWNKAILQPAEPNSRIYKFTAKDDGIKINLTFSGNDEAEFVSYNLNYESEFLTRLKLQLELINESELFHIIPANIFGDNNIGKAHPGEYPILTDKFPEDIFCSPYWEFRADRASTPVSILCCENGAVGISINPYSNSKEAEIIRNGVFSELPNKFGVTLGYRNTPVTFLNKRNTLEPTWDSSRAASTEGRIYMFYGRGRQEVYPIIRDIYYEFREKPKYKKTLKEAAHGLLTSFIDVNWSDELNNYTNRKCKVPEDINLIPWRQLPEIGWTAGGVMGYPFAAAEFVLGLDKKVFRNRKTYREIFQEITESYNEKSGLFNDVTNPDWKPDAWPSNVNGWWSGFGLSVDCHCAYTNGSAVAYLLKTLQFMKKYLNQTNEEWQKAALKVLDTMLELQREDGSYGYTYSQDEKKVLDWEGFAGCWFAEAMAYAYMETSEENYLDSAKKALSYYYDFVKQLCCWGTPMDTWKSVDEEGNLSFIRASRLLHEITGEKIYLDMLEAGANYEYLWKYSFRSIPETAPLKGSSWNSCGGSVTSVSNPHIHPMGMLVVKDLDYLAQQTGDKYHRDRADDTVAFMMNTMELYPEVTGYGQYGVLSERFCPSDGLLVESFSDGMSSSTWFSYNGWAAAAALEGIVERILEEMVQQ